MSVEDNHYHNKIHVCSYIALHYLYTCYIRAQQVMSYIVCVTVNHTLWRDQGSNPLCCVPHIVCTWLGISVQPPLHGPTVCDIVKHYSGNQVM